ncbi:hypothetical protein QJS10_CPB17g02314 [Acorus calamus]|uniref:Uncharacterized protein n=1 Tax=Acorus calamus TaxID=4465 RepID=A0AAV9CWN6_ACOCL|nr:hypothetical protein QJS10_CPB17g02314 [Acorus calamus]
MRLVGIARNWDFKENAYPSRDKKQQMVETMGITYQQKCTGSAKKNHGSEFTSSREGTVLPKSNQRDHKSEQRVFKNSSNNGDQENGSSEVMAISAKASTIDRGKKKISNEAMVSDNNYSPDGIGELVMSIAAEISPDDRDKEDGSAEVSMDDMDKTKESSEVGGTVGRVGGGQRKKQAVRKIYGGGGKQLVKQWNSAKLELLQKREKMGTQSPVGTSNSRDLSPCPCPGALELRRLEPVPPLDEVVDLPGLYVVEETRHDWEAARVSVRERETARGTSMVRRGLR